MSQQFAKKSGSCIKIRQFQYGSNKKLSHLSGSQSIEKVPIKIVVDRLSPDGKIEQAIVEQRENIQEFPSKSKSPKFHTLRLSSSDKYKKFITPRDEQYQAKPYVFDRYSYQNYKNYEYKNPFKPAKYPIVDNVIKAPKHKAKPNQKNIQIVFCETKLHDFVRKTNENIEQIYGSMSKSQIKSKAEESQPKPKKSLFSSIMNWSTAKNPQNQSHRTTTKNRFPKTTLANYLHEFNTLEKLSSFMEREQKLNQKYLCVCQGNENDLTKTVLLDIITHRFTFLRNMKKRTRQNLYQSLLNLAEITIFTKINIHEYLQFARLFIGKDASDKERGAFLYSFLYKKHRLITFEHAQQIIRQLNGHNQKKALLIKQLFDLFQENQRQNDNMLETESQMFDLLCRRPAITNLFIEIVTSG